MNWYQKTLKLSQYLDWDNPENGIIPEEDIDYGEPGKIEPPDVGKGKRWVTPADIPQIDDLGEEEELITAGPEDIPSKPEYYPGFTNIFQAIRWAKDNKEVMRIYYRCLSGRQIIRDIEPHGDFWAKTTSRRILVTFDETIKGIRGFITNNISKYDFIGKQFEPKFNFSKTRKNYKARLRNRKNRLV